MTSNRELRYEMMKFYANDFSCKADDFLSDENKVFLHNDLSDEFFRMKCFGNAAVARVHENLYLWCEDFISKYTGFRCFDGIEMTFICRELAKYDYAVLCGQGALPDLNIERKGIGKLYDLVTIKKNDIKSFYSNEIYGSFYPDDKEWHMLNYVDEIEYVVANYNKNKVTGFAIACKCTDNIYDIGYETLPQYRQQGIATAVTIELTNLLLDMNIIPFLTFAWSNIASKNVAIKSGYLMSWSSMGTSPKEFTEKVFRGEAE